MADVVFEAKLKASSLLAFDVPGPALIGQGGLTVLKILQMPREERIRIMSDAADDPIAVLLCMLTAAERVQLLTCAQETLKEIATRD